MALVGLKHTPSLPPSNPHHTHHVIERDRHHAQRRKDRVLIVAVVAGVSRQQRRRSNRKTHEVTSGVSHEDPRRRAIVKQKPRHAEAHLLLAQLLHRAKASDKTYVIVMKVDAYEGWTAEGHTWREVGTPHVTEHEKAREKHLEIEAERAKQRRGV